MAVLLMDTILHRIIREDLKHSSATELLAQNSLFLCVKRKLESTVKIMLALKTKARRKIVKLHKIS